MEIGFIESISEVSEEVVLRQHAFYTKLVAHIQQLIQEDVNRLIVLLYRMDVDEYKLRKYLSLPNEDSAHIIAKLLIERQVQKILNRQMWSPRNEDCTEEKW